MKKSITVLCKQMEYTPRHHKLNYQPQVAVALRAFAAASRLLFSCDVLSLLVSSCWSGCWSFGCPNVSKCRREIIKDLEIKVQTKSSERWNNFHREFKISFIWNLFLFEKWRKHVWLSNRSTSFHHPRLRSFLQLLHQSRANSASSSATSWKT